MPASAALARNSQALRPDLVFSDMRRLPDLHRQTGGASRLMEQYVCAVDVGTGSARAGIFDRAGNLLGRAEHPIADAPAEGRSCRA